MTPNMRKREASLVSNLISFAASIRPFLPQNGIRKIIASPMDIVDLCDTCRLCIDLVESDRKDVNSEMREFLMLALSQVFEDPDCPEEIRTDILDHVVRYSKVFADKGMDVSGSYDAILNQAIIMKRKEEISPKPLKNFN